MSEKIDFEKIRKALAGDKGLDEPGDYCELDKENPHIVHFYRKDGTWFMSMPLEDYEAVRDLPRQDRD